MVESLGRYNILKEIGQGGFAIVYRSHDNQLDRLVALKELRPIFLNNPASVKEFYREARNIARLDHPNIVTIYDVYEAEQRLFIVMQLVDGSSLAELIAKRGRLSWSETVALITAVATGLDYAYGRGILHRDLKPANILLDSNHGPMLSDFGLAKFMGEAGASVTAAGGVVGTPHYIAPEVWEGQGATHQSDIYALGCVLYEMLIGEKLFPGETAPAAMMAHFKGITLPKIWPKGVPSGVADVLTTALSRKPANRYATASEMAYELATLTPHAKDELVITQYERAGSGTEQISPSILTTKLYPPPTRSASNVVSRPRLTERLNEALHRTPGLILISAPAGFGKTTLVSSWLSHFRFPISDFGLDPPPIKLIQNPQSKIQNRVAWLSLDDGDNDPARFLTYFIAALQKIDPNLGKTVQGMLQSPQPPPIETLMTALINEISTSFTNVRSVFVLDDYHLIEAKAVHDALTFLLDHLPPSPGGIHLVIATRDDPHLPLARLRARGQLTELRATDLRFTAAEAAEFLNRVMSLDLSAEDIAALESRTEGWVAGLQLAAISMQGQKDVAGFIKSFTGSHHFILDYLIEEVLEQQPESIQTFLLQTSILDRLCGPLCDAVCSVGTTSNAIGSAVLDRGAEVKESRSAALHLREKSPHTPAPLRRAGQETLEHLQHANLFIVPLDAERRWYRYHHLFADLLRQRLYQTQKEQAPTLYIRASEWYEQNGFTDEAIEYALHAEHFERATQLIEGAAEAVWMHGEHTKLRRWVDRLPVEWAFSKPQLCIFNAWSLFVTGRQDAAEQSLQAAEKALDPNIGADKTSPIKAAGQLSGTDRMKLQGRIAATRAFMAFFRGDVSEIVQHARHAIDYLPEQDLTWRGTATVALGDAHIIKGEMAAAHQAQLEALKASRAAGNIYLTLITSLKLAITLKQQGKLRQSIEICRQQMQFAGENGLSETIVVGWLLAIWGDVLAELNNLDEAINKAQKGVELTRRGGDVAMVGWSYLCLTRVLFSNGDIAAAEDTIREMEHISQKTEIPPWVVNLLATWQVRIWLAQGKLNVASQWVAERGLDAARDPALLHEMEMNIALARVLMAQGRLDETATLLQRLLNAAKAAGRTIRAIEILILRALALQAQGDTDQAVATLAQALSLAEPGGFIRIFIDEGLPMTELLARLKDEGGRRKAYVHKLLAVFGTQKDVHSFDSPQDKLSPLAKHGVSPQPLVEPLSERELEVLRLIAEGFTNQEIATRLFLTLNTVKVHTRNIYGKLNVHSRTQAIARSQEMGLLARK